jgi:phospholipid/cholesterol/gamma-HCH transport system substrate-binding protein
MDKRKIEFYVGLFVVIGVICTTYLFVVLGEINFIKTSQYEITGIFDSVSGLKTGARIEIAGVQIGSVAHVSIDENDLIARVDMRIDKKFMLSKDSVASIKTSGIIGEKYISISPGGSDEKFAPGEELYDTESSLDIEALIRQVVFKTNSASN